MKLPGRMAKVSERMVIPSDSFVFKWVEPAVSR
jgi:acyl-[acyl-carrier-protein] desaturase